MHIVEIPNYGLAGVMCKDGSCQFTSKSKNVTEESILIMAKEVFKEELGVGDDYKVRLVKD